MNIFLFSLNPDECARDHCCRHLIKMANEIVQLLVTAISETERGGEPLPEGFLGPGCDPIPKPTHRNHPMAIAVRKHRAFFVWAARLGLGLCRRYTAVFSLPGRPPKVRAHYERLLRALGERGLRAPSDEPFAADAVLAPVVLPGGLPISVPLCMDGECVVRGADGVADAVASYRNYFVAKKQHLARWHFGATPRWYAAAAAPVLPPTKAELGRLKRRAAGAPSGIVKPKPKRAARDEAKRIARLAAAGRKLLEFAAPRAMKIKLNTVAAGRV